MKGIYICLLFPIVWAACDFRSKYHKAADEMAAKLPESTNMNVGKQNYSLYIPKGWTTEHRSAYGIDYYYLLAPKTEEDRNTSINVITEFMQNLSLEVFKTKAIESVKRGIPSASNFEEGGLTANGLQGAWYSYTMEPQGIKAALVSYIFPKDGIAYTITAGTEVKDPSRYRSLFDSIARSLKFTELVPVKK
ncbi:hypothetical protein Q4E93_04265 [Flavitalea sp. BT771]|uniref:hypothetical protein n=1 Tax=Flavitalea sp. BT771 TaxID=3063329 RepID=UPI0026E43040|nr:hypothetical protein [Flavitalea sp. BT771]MDO6429783.1 hypothetical protein [Flavitalea sp. BT771]MDV6218089.1 hypothetical protein [Flavitalea sp. BT771]